MILTLFSNPFTLKPRLKYVSILIILTFVGSFNASATHLLVYGDSLSAAYGMDEEKGWVSLLKNTPEHDLFITNASISGETSAGGLARFPLTLDETDPDLIILELGANDGLRGYSTDLLKQNLEKMIVAAQESDAKLVLAAISLPPTYGPRYIDSFREVYFTLSDQYDIPLLDLYQPSFVETPGFIQEDGLHPTEMTQPIIKDLVLNFLLDNKLLENPK